MYIRRGVLWKTSLQTAAVLWSNKRAILVVNQHHDRPCANSTAMRLYTSELQLWVTYVSTRCSYCTCLCPPAEDGRMTGVLYTGESTSAVHRTDISSGHSLDPKPIGSSCAAARTPRARVITNDRRGAVEPMAPRDKPGVSLCWSKGSARLYWPVECCLPAGYRYCCATRQIEPPNHLLLCSVRKVEHTQGGHTAATPCYICVELVPCIDAERERQGRWCVCVFSLLLCFPLYSLSRFSLSLSLPVLGSPCYSGLGR